jgi:hypothetical protein
MKFFRLLACCLFCFSTLMAYEHNIAVCCISQNEDRFLKEWIDYHRLIGVDHFYFYDHMSTDATYAVLEPYIKQGVVEYIYWERTYDDEKGWWHIQRDAYVDAVHRAENKSKWLAIIDTDEFIVPIQDYNLKAFLDDFDDFGGVCISWIFYGSSGVQTLSKKTWMTTQLVHRSDLQYSLNRMIKSIVRPERVNAEDSFFPHTCAYKNGYYHVNAEKEKLKRSVVRDYAGKRIRLHHYWSRDLDFLYQYKLPRYARWIGEERALEKVKIDEQMNECYDPIIIDVIKRLRTRKPPRN